MDDWKRDRVGAAERGENPTALARMRSGFAVIGDTQFLPGYCVLLASPQVGSLQDLDLSARAEFLLDMSLLGDAIRAVCRPRRINYDILGNTDPFLHAHVFPRYDCEPAKYVRLPPFRYPGDRWTDPQYLLSDDHHGPLRAHLRETLLALVAGAGRAAGEGSGGASRRLAAMVPVPREGPHPRATGLSDRGRPAEGVRLWLGPVCHSPWCQLPPGLPDKP